MRGESDVDAAKRALRARLREVRAAIAADPRDRLARSARIWARIVPFVELGAQSPGSGSQRAQMPRVLLFESLPTEPETAGWIEWCEERGIEVLLPEVDGPELRVMPGDVDPTTIDFIVVPGLAFTRDATRLGQGGGHFDRFLPLLADGCLRIGVAFREQIVDGLPVESHDVTLDLVVTD